MAPIDRSKRSIVKHATNKPFGQGQQGAKKGTEGSKRRAGFQVGPRHAPDGAYLGKVKRIKANLIANAKTKKQFYKSLKQEGAGAGRHADTLGDGSDSLGRFAPEAGPSTLRDEGKVSRPSNGPDDAQRRRRDRAGPAPEEANEDDQSRRQRPRQSAQKSFAPKKPQTVNDASKKDASASTSQMPAPAATKRKYASREEAVAARAERNEKWNRTSGSATGKKRGQPDLGARMEMLLDRIRGE
ncbi:unnamed protein product [Parajaminaea phylloscopi]